MVATGDTKGYVYLLNRQGHLLWEERLADKVGAVVLSTDGQRLLVGAGEKEKHLHAYDLAGRLLWRRYVEGSISSIALSANGQRVAVGTRDGSIYIFGQNGEILHKARAGKLVRQVAISATRERVVAGSEDGYLYGFQLPLLPTKVSVLSAKEEPIHQRGGTVYNIHIEKADHLAIGDYAQVQSVAEESQSGSTSLPSYSLLRLVRVRGEHRTYLIGEDGTRHWIPDGPTLETMADWEDVEMLANWDELAGFPPGRPLPSQVQGAKPWLVQVRGETDIYLIDQNEIRHRILDKAALKLINQRTEVDLLATWNELEKFQPGEPLNRMPS